MKINVLPSEIYNKISAGEVVERPANVVKELVENSIDGGATKINIEIFGGGIKKIIVSDNGCGISSDDIEKAFLPHSTSKITKEEDLYSISSLGFRGEALASISAVSKIEIYSKVEDEPTGTLLKINGGKIEEKREIGFETGTRLVVNDLFYNTPVRLKFLKKPKSEELEITNLMAKIIMANPQISFKYYVDEKVIYTTFGNGLAEAMYIIYGKETYNNLLEVNYEQDNINVFGYIAKPTFSKPNRSYQTLFVNGRVVTNYMVSAAVQDALEGYIMKGKFPLYALNITLPFNTVDVNVHPTKQEVKFEYPNKIYSIINNAIFKTVSKANYIQNTEINQQEKSLKNEIEINEKNKYLNLIKNIKNTDNNIELKSNENFLSKIISEKYINSLEINNTKNNEKEEKHEENNKNKFDNFIFKEIEINSEIISEKKQENIQNNYKISQENFNIFKNYKIIGILFKTYILIENENCLFIIDQHAAHERQLYDKYMAEMENNKIPNQQLLTPFVFTTNFKETLFLNENLKLLQNFGIEISEFGENSFKVSSVPMVLANINLSDFFSNILNDISSYLKKPISFLKDIIARAACRAAVKAGDNLTDVEIEKLLSKFNDEDNVLLCPHGRPIIIKFNKTEIEKWFKRIV